MITRQLLPSTMRADGLARGLERLEELMAVRHPDHEVDFPAVADRRSSLAESVSALGLFSALTALVSAGSVIGQGYAYSDVIVLLAVQLAASLAIWRIHWTRVSELWLLAIIGAQALFVASLISLTGGSSSPYVALYAPVLALAGWHLRPTHLVLAIGLVLGTELWRATVVDSQSSLSAMTVALPVFALLALLARLTSQRLTAAVVVNRRDQVRTAATLAAVRILGEHGPDEPLDLAGSLAEVFGASATIAAFDGDPDSRGCARPDMAHGHLLVQVQGAGGSSYGRIRLCRDEPFSASERRLAGILGDAMARAMEHRRLFEEVRSETQRDHLTGLLAGRAFEADLEQAVASAEVDGSPLRLYLLDVDDLQGINDRYGHGHGDAVLQRIARMLLAEAGPTDRVYRCGGDEFAVLMPGEMAVDGDDRGTRVRLAAGGPSIPENGLAGRLAAAVSVGTAVCRDGRCTPAGLLEAARADLAAVKAARHAAEAIQDGGIAPPAPCATAPGLA